MSDTFDETREDRVKRLPLPLAQLYGRARTAPTPLERHSCAFYLWEASLRLLASVAIVKYVATGKLDSSIEEKLSHLPRPVLWHWWEALRAIVPSLATEGDERFARVADLILGDAVLGLPQIAALDNALGDRPRSQIETQGGVSLALMFERLILYGRRQLGHGIDKQSPTDWYSRMGTLLLAGAEEFHDRIDLLAGMTLMYFVPSPRSTNDRPLMDRFELSGDVPLRHEPLALVLDASAVSPRPNQLYLSERDGARSDFGRIGATGLLPLDPLLQYDPELREVQFVNRSPGSGISEGFSFNSGRFATRKHPERPLLVRLGEILGIFPTATGDGRLSAAELTEGVEGHKRAIGTDSTGSVDSEIGGATGTTAGGSQSGMLQVIAGEKTGERIPLPAKDVILGRNADCDIVLFSSGASRQHAKISWANGEYFVQDLGSRNGTIVNGETIREPHQLQNGDRLKICDLSFAFFREQPSDLAGDAEEPSSHEDFKRQARIGLEFDDSGSDNSMMLAKLDTTGETRQVRASVNPEMKLRALIEIAENLRKSRSVESVLAKLLESIFKIFPQSDRGVVVRREADDGQLEIKLIKQRAAEPTDSFRVSRTMVNTVLDGKQAILWIDCAADSGFELTQSVADFRIRSMMCAPLINSDGESLGVVQIDTIDQRARFQEADLEVLADVANQAGIALEYAMLREHAAEREGIGGDRGADSGASSPNVVRQPQSSQRQGESGSIVERSTKVASAGLTEQDLAFSAQTVVTLYPAPIALAYRRFYQESEPRLRLDALFCVLEATVRYLVTLGVSELFHCQSESPDENRQLLDHAEFEFLRHPRPMLLGKWVASLRETARALGSQASDRRIVLELPDTCRPGGHFDAELLRTLVDLRNSCAHPDGSIRIPADECRTLAHEVRSCLEEALREIRFVCRYPLGFLSPFAGLVPAPGQHYYHLHSCMGAWIGSTSRALDIRTALELREDIPFIVAPDGQRLLYLWPLLLERRSEYTGRRTLWVFEEMPDKRRPFLTTVRSAAIDVPESWTANLHSQPAGSHAWLLDQVSKLPAAPAIPADLRLAEKLLPTRGGKLVGQEVGSNRLVSVIAIGGYGTIYAAEAADGQRVAIKVIESRCSATDLARFSQEIQKLRLAAEFSGIVRCFEHGDVEVDDRVCPWYSMEFAPGGDLRSRLDKRKAQLKGGLPWRDAACRAEVCGEFNEIASAVAHLHRLDIVHRDIKPGNILITEDGRLRLADFGLVKNLAPTEGTIVYGPLSSTGGGAGTPGYMAPEQARGGETDKAADVYSLGILLGELVLGERPKAEFPSHETRATKTAGLRSTLTNDPLRRQLPTELRPLIERCTAVAPENRPRDAQALLDEFNRLINPTGS